MRLFECISANCTRDAGEEKLKISACVNIQTTRDSLERFEKVRMLVDHGRSSFYLPSLSNCLDIEYLARALSNIKSWFDLGNRGTTRRVT